MPKVILKKSITTKVTPKTAEKSKETEKAKLKAERETLIDSQVEEISTAIEEINEAEGEVESKKIQLAHTLREWKNENEASEADVRQLVAKSMAKIGEYDVSELSGKQALTLHGSDASKLSVIMRLVCPKEEHEKAYNKAFQSVIEGKKKISLNKLVALARNGTVPTEGGGKGSGRTAAARAKQKAEKDKAKFDTIEAFKTALAGLLQDAEKSGFEDSEIEEAAIDQVTEWVERHEDKDEE